MPEVQRSYVPAAGHDFLLPLYDSIVKMLGGERAHQALVDEAELQPTERVLEVGCGTGTLLMRLKRQYPRAEVVGLDPDPHALARATRKADAAALQIQLDRGFADALPYPDESFDRVFSCFMFHHLAGPDQKLHMLREVRRVLKPGGLLHLLDFVPEREGWLARRIHSAGELADNAEDRVLSLMREAGLTGSTTTGRGRLRFMFRTASYRAGAPPLT